MKRTLSLRHRGWLSRWVGPLLCAALCRTISGVALTREVVTQVVGLETEEPMFTGEIRQGWLEIRNAGQIPVTKTLIKIDTSEGLFATVGDAPTPVGGDSGGTPAYPKAPLCGLVGDYKLLHHSKDDPDAADGGVLQPGEALRWPLWLMSGRRRGFHVLRMLVRYSGVATGSASKLNARQIKWACQVGAGAVCLFCVWVCWLLTPAVPRPRYTSVPACTQQPPLRRPLARLGVSTSRSRWPATSPIVTKRC